MIYQSENEIKEKMSKTSQKLEEIMTQENPDKDLITKLMYQQLIQSLYLQNF
jgi:hypothetical protein